MKSLPLVVAALAIALSVPLGQAQDSSPAPNLDLRATDPMGRSEPSIVVPSENSRSNYPKPGTPMNTPRPSPSPATAASTAASPAKTRTTTTAASPTPSKAATPAGPAATSAASGGKTNVPATIRDLESRWASAIQTHDVTVPQQLVAADYVGVNSAGRVVNKSTLLSEMRRDKNTYDSAVNSGVTVRVHGNAAVAVGTTKQAGKKPTGEAFDYTYRWTDTWLERNGQWQCVASQSFLVTR